MLNEVSAVIILLVVSFFILHMRVGHLYCCLKLIKRLF